MGDVSNRLRDALNAHDIDAFVDCFATDYRSEQPAHPARAFRGSHQVRQNWSAVFAGVPDLRAEMVVAASEGEVEIAEWRWWGAHADGAPFEMRGVTVFGIADNRIAWGRLYMEPVESEGADINQMVADTYRAPPST